MSEPTECPTCEKEWMGSNPEFDDLCPECMDLLRENCTELLLHKKDGAIIIRHEGEDEVFLPLQDENDDASQAAMITAMLALVLQDKELFEMLEKRFQEKLEESIETALDEEEKIDKTLD